MNAPLQVPATTKPVNDYGYRIFPPNLSLRVHYFSWYLENLGIVIVSVLKSKDLCKYSCRKHKLNCGKKSSFHEQDSIIQ